MTDNYIKLTSEQVSQWQGVVKDGIKQFFARQTIHGYYVCAVNTLNEFPEAFTNEVIYVDLSIEDFINTDIS
jgi:hypothetical protein